MIEDLLDAPAVLAAVILPDQVIEHVALLGDHRHAEIGCHAYPLDVMVICP